MAGFWRSGQPSDPPHLSRRSHCRCRCGSGSPGPHPQNAVIHVISAHDPIHPFPHRPCSWCHVYRLARQAAQAAQKPRPLKTKRAGHHLRGGLSRIPRRRCRSHEFIAGQVTYPESARDGVEGKVFVEFTISETGAVTNAHVIEPLHPALDSAASRCLWPCPTWAPATKEGKAIATTITLPVMFSGCKNIRLQKVALGSCVLGPPFAWGPR